jgi:hypothetical protein
MLPKPVLTGGWEQLDLEPVVPGLGAGDDVREPAFAQSANGLLGFESDSTVAARIAWRCCSGR